MSTRDEYVTTMKAQLDALNATMSELEEKAKDVKQDARDTYRDEMNALRRQSDLAVAKLDELKTRGEDSWGAMVAEMENVRDAFIHSFRYFKSQI